MGCINFLPSVPNYVYRTLNTYPLGVFMVDMI